MTALRVLVVDDEPLARKRVERGVAQVDFAEVAGSAGNGVEAIRLVRELQPDIILLDVRMPGGLDGFDLLSELPAHDPPVVIFVTAFDEYAVRAFDAAAVDYVLKPVDFGRLGEALRRARDVKLMHQGKERARELETIVEALRARDSAQTSRFLSEFWVRTGGDYVRIRPSEIDWIEAERDYTRLHVGPRSYLYERSLGELEEELDPAIFARIHRSAIVRRSALALIRKRGFRGLAAQLTSGADVPIGRTYVGKVKAALGRARQ
jgi:two-component system, LytTR family, response regulator